MAAMEFRYTGIISNTTLRRTSLPPVDKSLFTQYYLEKN
jgi:hypothetical protein